MVCLLCLKCRGDPRGRPQEHSLCKNRTRTPFLAGRKQAFLAWSGADGVKCSSVFSLDILVNICYTPLMKTTLTAKLKLHTTPEQFQALRTTQLVYRDALNYVSRYAFEHGKMSNKVGLQEGTYQEIRARYRLPAQMACSVPRQVGATYKALWTKVKQNAVLRKAGKTKKRYKGLDKAPKYVSPTLTYQLGHDYSFKKEQQVSILTLEGRVIVPYTGYDQHVTLLQHGASIGAAKLWYDKPHKQWLMADFGEAGTAEVDGRGRRDDTLLSRRTRPTVLTEKRGRDGKQSVDPSSPRDAD